MAVPQLPPCLYPNLRTNFDVSYYGDRCSRIALLESERDIRPLTVEAHQRHRKIASMFGGTDVPNLLSAKQLPLPLPS